MNYILLPWKNLINRPLSLTLTLVLFALGVGLTSLLMLLNKQLTDKFGKNLAGVDVVVGAKGSPLQLILCNMYHVDMPTGNISLKTAKPFLNPKHPLIKNAIPLSLGDSYKGFRIVGTIKDFTKLYNGEIAQGALWNNPMETTIGASVAQKTGLTLGNSFMSNHGLTEDGDEHAEHKFTVTGIFKPTGTVLDQLIVTSYKSIWAVHDHEASSTEGGGNEEEKHDHDHADEHKHDKTQEPANDHNHDHAADIPKTTPADDRAALLQEDSSQSITSMLLQFKVRNVQTLNFQRNINENTDMQAATPALEINRLFEMIGVGEQALRARALLIIIVSGLSIFIALFNSLKERKYELALMRVMGAGRAKLFTLIIIEGLLLSFMGFIIGILLSHGAMQLLAKYMSDAYRYTFSGWTWLKEEWYLLFGALVIGFLAAIIPASTAYKTDISRTLSKS
jgi:putative ABC transport system permease protein